MIDRLSAVGKWSKVYERSIDQTTYKAIQRRYSQTSSTKHIVKYTGAPVIDEERLFFTLLPLFNGEEWEDSQKSLLLPLLLSSLPWLHMISKRIECNYQRTTVTSVSWRLL